MKCKHAVEDLRKRRRSEGSASYRSPPSRSACPQRLNKEQTDSSEKFTVLFLTPAISWFCGGSDLSCGWEVVLFALISIKSGLTGT